MNFHRYGRERSSNTRATTGDVFVALSRDSWARQMLGEIYRKLFEGAGLRQGSSPDHFIYVTPSKARSEINELASWVNDRFGPPGSTVPAKTPFGYISGPWDGWLTLFAALSYGTTDQGLAIDFTESVAGLSWSAAGSRSRSGACAAGTRLRIHRRRAITRALRAGTRLRIHRRRAITRRRRCARSLLREKSHLHVITP